MNIIINRMLSTAKIPSGKIQLTGSLDEIEDAKKADNESCTALLTPRPPNLTGRDASDHVRPSASR